MSIFSEIVNVPKYLKLLNWWSREKDEAAKGVQMNGQIVPGWKTPHFWVSLCISLSALIGQIGGIIPSPWGFVVPAVLSFVYAIARQFEKANVQKPALKSTEFYAVLCAGLIALIGEIGGLLPPETARMIMAVATGGLAMIKVLSGQTAPLPVPEALPGRLAPTPAAEGSTPPAPPSSAGSPSDELKP